MISLIEAVNLLDLDDDYGKVCLCYIGIERE